MKVWKRISAFLCAALLILNLALYPLRARAMAGALTAVGAAVTVSAFLMACGIYPYVSENGQSFGEWGAQSLYDLWSQYVDTLEAPPNGGTTQEAFNNIKSFVVGGALAIASGTWETLRGFATWIVSYFSLTDNQEAVQIGSLDGGYYELPVFDATPPVSSGKGLRIWNTYNIFSDKPDTLRGEWFVGALGSLRVFGAVCYSDASHNYIFFRYVVPLSKSEFDSLGRFTTIGFDYNSHIHNTMHTVGAYKSTYTFGGRTYYYLQDSRDGTWATREDALSVGDSVYAGNILLPIFDSNEALLQAVFGISDVGLAGFRGVVADTKTVAPVEALPADTPYGGLAVPGAGTYPTAATVQDVIQTGVIDREKPVVTPVEVELGQGVTVDEDTGAVEITENPVVVTPEEVAPSVAALTPSAAFLEALQTTMTTKFPFCLPFDLFKILQAFYVAPEAPVFYLSFHDPFTNADYSITVDLSPWDNVAAVVRNFEAMILLAGFCLNFDKFNVIHLILGGLG